MRSLCLDELIAFVLTILAGVLVSLVTLWLAGRQRTNEETQAEERRRKAVLAAIGAELRWNRTATRGTLDASNAHVMVGTLATVAFERHGADLATIAPDSIEPVFEHYALICRVREGIRAFAGPRGRGASENVRNQWIKLSEDASRGISNSATASLQSLRLPLET